MIRIYSQLNLLLKHAVFLFVFAGLFLTNSLKGAEVDSITAKTVAGNFYLSRLYQSSLKQSTDILSEIEFVFIHQENFDSSKKGVQIDTDQPIPLYYVFNVNDNKGFIIVSGDDRVTPILGYSFTGAFSLNDQPPAFTEWMNSYNEQIQYQIENNSDADASVQEKWSSLTDITATKSQAQMDEVMPLLSTNWSQECYYNAFCPDDNDGPCDHALVGCVAVAMGQIMKYWDHPVSSNRIPGYYANSEYGCLSDIVPTTYNWASMPNGLNYLSSSTEVDAESELLYNCGISTLMEYGPDGSGAFSGDARNAMISYFDYSSSMQHVSRMTIDSASWESMLRDELDNNRPVYYTGTESLFSAGHAFVCDGYQELNFFHFNWGWNGMLNGYFYLSDMTPGSNDFNSFQTAIIGIEPEANQPDPFENILEIGGTGTIILRLSLVADPGMGYWQLRFFHSWS